MLRISIAAAALYVITLAGFSQTPKDSSNYQSRTLKLEEVNFISSYYNQNGNNSAVTGGIGTEKLHDFSNNLEVKFFKYDSRKRRRTVTADIGLDFYTSASSDMINPATISSPSSHDTRFYPSLSYTVADAAKRVSSTVGGYFSLESDYYSRGLNYSFSKTSKDRNREVTIKNQIFFDVWDIILPYELRGPTAIKGHRPRNTYSTSITISQVLTQRLQVALLGDVAYQAGQLATLFQRVYFTDNTHSYEQLPSRRFKIPLGLRMNYFLGDTFIFRAYYRYYKDSWGLSANTAELEVPIKISPFFSVSPFYRYYKQKGIRYFAAYGQHQSSEQFFTSDYDLSTMHSVMAGTGIRYSPPGGVLGLARFSVIELRYGHYNRSTGLRADIVTLLLKYK